MAELIWKPGLKAKVGDIITDLGERWKLLLPVDSGLTRHCHEADKKFYEHLGPAEATTAPVPAPVVTPAPVVVTPAPPAFPAKPTYEQLEALVAKLQVSEAKAQEQVVDLTRQLLDAQRPDKPLLTLTSVTPQ